MRPAQPVTVNGRTYPSMSAAARACGVPLGTFWRRLKRGVNPAVYDIQPGRHGGCRLPRPCEYDGVRYSSLGDCAVSLDLTEYNARELVETSGKFLDE